MSVTDTVSPTSKSLIYAKWIEILTGRVIIGGFGWNSNLELKKDPTGCTYISLVGLILPKLEFRATVCTYLSGKTPLTGNRMPADFGTDKEIVPVSCTAALSVTVSDWLRSSQLQLLTDVQPSKFALVVDWELASHEQSLAVVQP